MLELHPNCELCDCDLPPASFDARICSYECTFCAACVQDVLHNTCPNCGGGFVPRPIRPVSAWRDGTGLLHHPAGQVRKYSKHTKADIAGFGASIQKILPEDR
jgi:hypothetical protein